MSRPLLHCVTVMLALSVASHAEADKKDAKKKEEKVPAALNFNVKTLEGKEISLHKKYKGKVVLVINVASQCGLTPQYEQLQALHDEYGKKGLAVVAFPCNQFGAQEPGTAKEIRQFCTDNYGVKFDMMAKVDVNGDSACDLYKYLTEVKTKPQGPGKIGWNFEKFLIGRDGEVVARFSPRVKPTAEEVIKAVRSNLAKKSK